MKSKQLKFLIASVAIVVVLAWLGYQGINESMSYFQTVPELYASGEKAFNRNSIKVQGEVVKGSIRREGGETVFVIGPKDFKVPENFSPGPGTETLRVRYVGKDAMPDTFRDYASAIVTGKLRRDGEFEGTFIQAQCASKYERENAAGLKETAENK
jgi:cytochrome c-type biogenesis protein CcmE